VRGRVCCRYRRERDGSSVMIALNLGDQPVDRGGAERDNSAFDFLDRGRETIEGAVGLRGNEGMIIDTSGIYAG
jgi:hypothetical protein